MMFNSFNNFDDMENFEQMSMDDFDQIIHKFNLKPDFILTRDHDKIMINEIWSSPMFKTVSANRIYEFDVFFIELIPEEIKKRLLQEVLDIFVEDERYEEAAEVRDEIKNII
jgi:hypothetical protein